MGTIPVDVECKKWPLSDVLFCGTKLAQFFESEIKVLSPLCKSKNQSIFYSILSYSQLRNYFDQFTLSDFLLLMRLRYYWPFSESM